ncbi:Ephrin type-A receptor 2 [Leucoagaricus sp. SymC.cos]|nr:Ephrin type-A receptor 2 [Leucoagaricus sp. SymC.cos]
MVTITAIERLSKSRGPSQSLPNLPEPGLKTLIYDIAREMKIRRPQDSLETLYPFLSKLTFGEDNASGLQIGRKWLSTLALNDFELLCYEICVEIERRYLNPPTPSEPERKVASPLPAATKPNPTQAARRWQVRNAMAGDWSESDVSLDSDSESEALDFGLSDTSQETVLCRDSPGSRDEKTNMELETVCDKLMKIFRDRSRYKLLLGYRDLEAQAVLNLLQNLLDSPRVKSTKLKKELAVAIQRLSKKSALYPECFVLKDVSIQKNSDGSIHTISSGKFGDVWRGTMQDQDVCLKVMRVYRNSKIHDYTFSCEAVLWGQLQHGNVLPFYGVYRLEHPTHSRICLVSPWMQNGNVDEYLVKEPNADRIVLIRDVASGLKYLHTQNIVHGDLKGANVLVNSSGKACLADFGLSTIRDPEVIALTTSSSPSGCGGTIRWMAPEPLGSYDTDEPVNTKKSDIYAFAGVSYEVFTGHVPFYEVFRDQTVILKINRGERPSRPDREVFLKSGMTEGIWQLMQDCWSTEPANRPTASEILNRLNTIRKTTRKSRAVSTRTPPSGRSTPTQGQRIPPSLQRSASSLSPNLFRASFAQEANLEGQLKRKDFLRLLDVSTEPLLDYR